MSHLPPAGFRLDTELGGYEAGGAFVVTRDDTSYVCKRLGSRALDHAGARRRLADEARILAALDGRDAPRLVAYGEDERGPFVVMERVDLPTLAARSPAPSAFVARAAVCALAALARIHEAADARGPLAIVHADISPANLLVDDTGDRVTFIDFGLARWRESTEEGNFRGTLAFAAPEQARGEPIDARADLFALAASLLSVASGAPPRRGDSEAALLVRAGEATIHDFALRAAAPLPASVASALVACVAFDPADRPRDARAALARAMCGA